ncbi:MAG: GNAT family N-acetyltransferase [Chloroflexota bacterium]
MGRLVVLEPLAREHEQDLYRAAQDMDWAYMPYDPSWSPQAFRGWLEEALERSQRGEQAAFAILQAASGQAVGSTRYMALRPEHRGLEIGWTWLRRSLWGTGANAEAKLLLLEHAFERLACMRVELKTDARNARSRAALEALPARFEGIFRKHMLVGHDRSQVRDSAWYAITDEEWPAVKARLLARLARTLPGESEQSGL